MDQRKVFATFFLIFAALVIVRAYKPEAVNSYSSRLLIDCGSSVQSSWSGDELYKWETDEQFIQTGENKILPSNLTAHEMNSLRFFPEGHKNCYKVPFQDGYQNRKYIFRAGFYYGNYDSLLNPPSFGLEIDGFFWANVTTSMRDEPVYHEMLYMRKRLTTTICLVRTSEEDGIPFISSIDAIETYNTMYNLMNNKTAFHLQSRINYGANQSVEQSITPSEDLFARIWKSKEMPNYLNIHSQRIAYGRAYSENYPPWKVMDYAIQAKNTKDSLYLPLNFSSQTLLQAYIVLYFMDPIVSQLPSKTCNVEIYIDGIKMATTDIPNGFPGDEYRVVSLFPVAVVGGSANLTISPLEGSTLAPILNAMEVYSASDVSKGGNLLIDFPVLFLIAFLQLICFLVL